MTSHRSNLDNSPQSLDPAERNELIKRLLRLAQTVWTNPLNPLHRCIEVGQIIVYKLHGASESYAFYYNEDLLVILSFDENRELEITWTRPGVASLVLAELRQHMLLDDLANLDSTTNG